MLLRHLFGKKKLKKINKAALGKVESVKDGIMRLRFRLTVFKVNFILCNGFAILVILFNILIGRRNVYADIGSDASIPVQEKEENTVEQKKDTGYSWTHKILVVGGLAIATAGRIYIYIKTGGARGGLNDSSPAADSMEKRVKITKGAVENNGYVKSLVSHNSMQDFINHGPSQGLTYHNVASGLLRIPSQNIGQLGVRYTVLDNSYILNLLSKNRFLSSDQLRRRVYEVVHERGRKMTLAEVHSYYRQDWVVLRTTLNSGVKRELLALLEKDLNFRYTGEYANRSNLLVYDKVRDLINSKGYDSKIMFLISKNESFLAEERTFISIASKVVGADKLTKCQLVLHHCHILVQFSDFVNKNFSSSGELCEVVSYEKGQKSVLMRYKIWLFWELVKESLGS